MKGAAEGARLPVSERSPAIVRLPFMFVMLSTISVNRRGPLSMPRAELGIHGLKAGAATGLEKVRETRSSSSQKRSEPAALRGQGGNEHGGSPFNSREGSSRAGWRELLTPWGDERVRSLSHCGAVSYYSAGSIALENANDAGEVACNKPDRRVILPPLSQDYGG
jgi:hypothetical protein